MAHEDPPTLHHQIGECCKIASSLGLELQVGSDFEEFRKISFRQPLKPHVNPAFDPDFSNICPETGFWMLGRSPSNEVVLTQAIKLLDLTGTNLENHFSRQLWNFRTHGYNFDANRCTWHLTPASAKITGRTTYHGELWLKGGTDGYRGGCLATIMTRLMILISISKWSPDFMIGLQSPMTTCRGLAAREGYMHMEQRSILWYQHGSVMPVEDWLVWMSREDAAFNLRIAPQFFFQLFEETVNVNTMPPAQRKKSQLLETAKA